MQTSVFAAFTDLLVSLFVDLACSIYLILCAQNLRIGTYALYVIDVTMVITMPHPQLIPQRTADNQPEV
jgi:hypothetical protein